MIQTLCFTPVTKKVIKKAIKYNSRNSQCIRTVQDTLRYTGLVFFQILLKSNLKDSTNQYLLKLPQTKLAVKNLSWHIWTQTQSLAAKLL